MLELHSIAEAAWQIRALMEGAPTRSVDKAVEQLTAEQSWEMLSHVLLTASEVAARSIVDTLIELEVVEPLVTTACLRREARRPGISVPSHAASARRIFRDFEKDEEGGGVPEHIMREAESIAAAAQQARQIAMQREAELDRDPIRARIVEGLADRLNTSAAALDALVVIAQASAWEDTRRDAAIKVANNRIAMGKLLDAGRIEDILALREASASRTVSGRLAAAVGEQMPEASHPAYAAALELVAEHHPDADRRREARQQLGEQ